MLEAARPHLLRIIGPNTPGLLSPVAASKLVTALDSGSRQVLPKEQRRADRHRGALLTYPDSTTSEAFAELALLSYPFCDFHDRVRM